MKLSQLKSLGFDRSVKTGRYLHVYCSQCQALVINGMPTHETGCPNAVHECAGCNTLLPLAQKYCADCRMPHEPPQFGLTPYE